MTDLDALDLRPGADGEVVASGAVDLSSATQLDQALRDAASGGGTGDVVLDAGDINFIDSSGLNVLVRVGAELRDAGRRLVIRRPQDLVARALEIGGLTELVAIDA